MLRFACLLRKRGQLVAEFFLQIFLQRADRLVAQPDTKGNTARGGGVSIRLLFTWNRRDTLSILQ